MIPFSLFGGYLGWGEIAVILFVALVIFGSRLPQVGRWLGSGMREFKDGIEGKGEDEGEDEKAPDSTQDEAQPKKNDDAKE